MIYTVPILMVTEPQQYQRTVDLNYVGNLIVAIRNKIEMACHTRCSILILWHLGVRVPFIHNMRKVEIMLHPVLPNEQKSK